MQTKTVKIDSNNIDQNAMAEAAEIIRQGGLVAFPTETVYGLGADALRPEASKKIYEAKGRPSDNPLIVHICEFEQLVSIAKEVPKEAKVLADAFWPGPLTMIVWKNDRVPYATTGGMDTVGDPYAKSSDRIIPDPGEWMHDRSTECQYLRKTEPNVSSTCRGRPCRKDIHDLRRGCSGHWH